jgi:predicted nucleotidyltransferase
MMEIPSVDGHAALEAVLPEIRAIGKKHGISRIIFFGSRARGDCHEKSDIDLAVSTEADPYGRARIASEFDDLRTLSAAGRVHPAL